MPWIDVVRPEEASGELAELYRAIAGARGGVARASQLAGERALLDWAVRTTTAPSAASERDLDELRAHGYDDRALLDAALTIGYFNFVNRLVLLLGVALEEGYERTCAPEVAAG